MDAERQLPPETMEWIRKSQNPYAILSFAESEEAGEPTAQARKPSEQPASDAGEKLPPISSNPPRLSGNNPRTACCLQPIAISNALVKAAPYFGA